MAITFPPLFIPPVHMEIDKLANERLSTKVKLGTEALNFIGDAQSDIDLLTIWDPGQGGLFESPRHVHAVDHIGGDAFKVCEEVATNKNLPKPNPDEACKVSFQDLIDIDKDKAVNYISTLILKTQGNLDSQQVGSILYLLTTFFHYYQDLKHLKPHMANWRAHILEPAGKNKEGGRQHLVTDAFPTDEMKSAAIERTAQFAEQFWKRIEKKVNNDEYFAKALSAIRDFKIEPGEKAANYKPSNYSDIVRSREGRLPSRWDSPINIYSGLDFIAKNLHFGVSLRASGRLFKKNRIQGWIAGTANAYYETQNSVSFMGKIEFGLVPIVAAMLTIGPYGKVSQSFLPDKINTKVEAGLVVRLESPILTALLCENLISFGLETQIPLYSSGGLSTPMVLGVAYVALP